MSPSNIVGLRDIKLPPKIRKRGRPKGAEKTTIGLPRKKKKENKPVPFLKKYPTDREKGQSINKKSGISLITYTLQSSCSGLWSLMLQNQL